ncbi:DUF4214 domain-containing protein [Marivita sp.]|uniref:DUF4214 domain-containing protein n=1 Tax=Marivita sp. TaxID=2003365 RepID=UPI0025BD77BE|nr:DUF4214 domain-containing protein [Marivita sp.]
MNSLGAADDYLPGSSADVFGSATVDVPTGGSIDSEGDRDRFDVALQAGVLYNISLEGIDTGGGSLVNPEIIGVFNSLGQRVAGGANNDGGVGANALVERFVVDADGTYQIEVASAQAGNVGDYTLTVESAGFLDDFLPGVSGGFGDVSIGGRTVGEIESSGDIDGFRVSLQANTTYEISILGNDSGNGTLLDPDLLGIFTSGNLNGTPTSSVQTLNTQFVGDDSVSYFTPQSAGEYFIAVQDSFGGVGTYAVAVENIGVRDDFAADIDTTGSIVPGGSAVGRIDFVQDNDWFEVSLAANRLYEIELVPTNNANAIADPFFTGVYDSNGNLIENTDNDDGGVGTSSALQFVADQAGTYYLSAGGFGGSTGQYRLELNDLGILDDNTFDITIEYTSDDVPSAYIDAFEDAVERWEEIITGDLPYGFVEGYGFVDDILIEVSVQQDIELVVDGVEQTILAISTVLDQRSDASSGAGPLPTNSLIVLNSDEIGTLSNLNELAQNTIGRALGFGFLWEEFGLVRDIDGVATYTGPNALREMEELSDDLNGRNVLEDGADGALAAEYWSEANLTSELMTPRILLRRPLDGPAEFGRPDNPISELTIAAMQDLGYQVDYDAADFFGLRTGPLARESSVEVNTQTENDSARPLASQRLLDDLPDNDEIPNGTAYIHTRPNILSESPASFALTNANSELVTATGTNVIFIEGATGENFVVELKGTFEKNDPASVVNLVGTVDSMEVRSVTGLLLFSVDYTQSPTAVTDVLSQWPNYSMDDDNVIIVDSLDGTVARINPNGGGENESRIFSGAGDDYVRGGDMAEFIHGGSGDDTLMGSAGNDVLEGGGGIDTAVYSGDQSSYTLQFSPTGTTITDRRSSEDGTDTLINIEALQFADGNFDIGIRLGAVGLSTEDFASIVELYIAYFNRAPAALGLLYWATRLEDGMTLPQIAQSFFEQPEIQRTYDAYLNADGSLNDTEAFVTAVFNNVLGRDPSGPYWINELETNPAITPAIFILSVLNGAKAPTGGAGDRAYLGDKTDIGVYFSAIKGLSEFEDTVSVMGLYDGSSASVNAAVSATDQIYAEALDPNSGEFLMPLVGVIDDPFAVA